MKCTVAQFNVVSKNIEVNFQQIIRFIEEAKTEGYQLVVFPEYSLSGYGVGDHFLDEQFISELESYHQKIIDMTQGITVVLGSIIQKDALYSGALIISNGEVSYSIKNKLTKREFNENRYFTSGENQVIVIDNNRVLISFKDDYQDCKKDYDYLVILDSSPINHYPVIETTKSFIYSNSYGITMIDKVVFINGGNSFIVVDDSCYALTDWNETGLVIEENNTVNVTHLAALVSVLQLWDEQNFNKGVKWIVGNSGGIDSAVTIALLTIALGDERVITYNLASKYNSHKTKGNAQNLADALGIKNINGSIQALVDETVNTVQSFNEYQEIPVLVEENIQARVRGHVLSTFAALEGGVVSNNGNKLEMVLGYATMYGDTIGAVAILGDLKKVEVFELSKDINVYLDKEVIPHNLIPIVDNYTLTWDMPPSAELKEKQVDPMKWYYHDLLVDMILTESRFEIMNKYYLNQFADLEIGKWLKFYQLDKGDKFIEDLNWFYRNLEISQFKRLQTPPVIAIGDKVVGVDYVETPLLKVKSKQELEMEQLIISKY